MTPLSAPYAASFIKAVILVQKTYRGHRERCFLSRSSRMQATDFLARQILAETPRAVHGHTPVYLPSSLPHLVFKEANEACIPRLKGILWSRQICRSLPHLVIPQAARCNNFLIEQKLLLNVSPDVQASIYLTEAKDLDPVIRDFVHFVFLTSLGYFIQREGYLKNCAMPRTDNFPFFYSHKCRKIALIDLEHIRSPVNRTKQLQDLIFLFPLHGELIKREAEKYLSKDTIETLQPVLGEAVFNGKRWLKFIYSDWIDYKKSRSNHPLKLFSSTKRLIQEQWKSKHGLSQHELDALDASLNKLIDYLNLILPPFSVHDEWQKRSWQLALADLEEGFENESLGFKPLRRKCSFELAYALLESLAEHKVIYHVRRLHGHVGLVC